MASCKPDFDKYERPEWIGGRLFESLQSIPDLDLFVACVKRSGYDTILSSGNYSVFAPDNAAMEDYLIRHPLYHSVYDLPQEDVVALVKCHIIQNPWSRDQLQSANEEGWIDRWDPYNSEPWGYKRQTLLKEKNREYWILRIPSRDITQIVDSTLSNEHRIVYQPSRKYIPFFFDTYMDIAGISSRDYEFTFDRPYEAGYIYMANAQLSPEDYFAENGFIFKLDRVVPPLKNAEQLLESTENGNNYRMFLDLIYLFPTFIVNRDQTNMQPGVREGLVVPTLYDLDYNDLVFDIHEEMTGRDLIDEKTTTRYHYGLIAPTSAALQEMIDSVITVQSGDSTRWPTFNSLPKDIKRILVNSHMSRSPIFLSDLENGFLNGEWDTVFVDPESVIEKHYASNATYFGVDKAIVPRAFTSVLAPVYLRPQYQGFMRGVELSGLSTLLKRKYANYSFFAVQVRDGYFENGSVSWTTNQILNQIGAHVPKEIARKEFIPTLAGNFILYDTTRRPVQLEDPTDNGKTYAASSIFSNYWLSLYDRLEDDYPEFFNLMNIAGMVDHDRNSLKFIDDEDLFTLFVPSRTAISKYNTDTLSKEELQQFIKYHFVRDEIIFTDGNKPAGEYATLRINESSHPYYPSYSKLYIQPEPDRIKIFDKFGYLTCDLAENSRKTNIRTGARLSSYYRITTGAIHEINTVLIYHQP